MKLYTEEQMHTSISLALGMYGLHSDKKHNQNLIDLLTPIKLPSDMLCVNCDESKPTHNICMDCIIKVGKQNIELPSDEEIDDESMNDFSWSCGAKWMRDKIQGGKNEQTK